MTARHTRGFCMTLLVAHLAVGAAAVGPDAASPSPEDLRWDEIRRFAPLMSGATERGDWQAALAPPGDAGAVELSDPQLKALASRLPRLEAIVAIGRAISAQGSLNEQNLAELAALGLERFVDQVMGDVQGQQLTELDITSKIAQMGRSQMLGNLILESANAERAEILSMLCAVADQAAGPEHEGAQLRFEVWQEPDADQSALRAINLGDTDLPSIILSITSTLPGEDSPRAEVIYVESWPTGDTITLPTRLAGMTTAHAPRLAYNALQLSAWSPESSYLDRSLDMPAYARDQRVPPPNSVTRTTRPPTARFALVDDADAVPRPDVIDPSGEPLPGWDRVPLRQTPAMQASRAIRGVFQKFQCGECTGAGTVTRRIPRYAAPVRGQPFQPVIGYDEVTEECAVCGGQKFAKSQGGDGMMEGFVRAASGVSPDDPQYDAVQSAIREEIARVLDINPAYAPERLNTRAREHLSNPRLRPASPVWLVANASQDVTAESGEVFLAATMVGTPGTAVALELPTFDAAAHSERCVVGGLYDGHIRLRDGRIVPVLRGAFRIGP